ncbi:hypothetical protein QLR68_36285, partial [Micromonospora sp. DH15]|nr:hypothetical protein [Micromonospora sp. DH15]
MPGVALVRRDQFVVAEPDVQTGRVGGDPPVASAQQPPERLPGRLRRDDPQGGVERADGPVHRAREAR